MVSYCWSCSWRQLSCCISLCIPFVEPRVGKAWAERLEGDSRSSRNCRHVYSLLAGSTAITQPLSWLAQQSWQQTRYITSSPGRCHRRSHAAVMLCFLGGAHLSLQHKVACVQASTSWCAGTVLQMISAVTRSLFMKCGVREAEQTILANLLSLCTGIYTMEGYLVMKNNEITPFAATWMDLETILLSEVSQKERDKYHFISLICGF